MIKKFLIRMRDKFWRKQDKKLRELQKSVDDLKKAVDGLKASELELKKKLEEQKKQTTDFRNYVTKEMERRDLWKLRASEIKWLAKGKKIWVIKSPEPDNETRFAWGEHYFANTIKLELEKLGYYVVIDTHPDWYCEVEADVVLVLGRCYKYHPDRRNPNCKYIFWHLSHPDNVKKEEYELYDLVLIASDSYAERMKKELDVPVRAMHSCVDTSIFFPQECDKKYDYVFVGNTRGKKRPLVMWCEQNEIPLHIWGLMTGAQGWKNYVKQDSSITLERTIANSELPELYRSAGVVVNDHFEDMLRTGFFANRILEVLACGCPLLSDYSQEIESIFGDSILYCRNEEEFLQQLKYLQEHYEEQKEKVLAIWPKLQKEFSFEVRAKELAELAEQLSS